MGIIIFSVFFEREKMSWVVIRVFDVDLSINKCCKTILIWFPLCGAAVCILSLDLSSLGLCEVSDIGSCFLYTFMVGTGMLLKLCWFLYGIDL